jgi:hypothetical protein
MINPEFWWNDDFRRWFFGKANALMELMQSRLGI